MNPLENKLARLSAFCRELCCPALAQEPMSAHTSFKIGGPADLFVTPEGVDKLAKLLAETSRLELPTMVVGKGTNLLVRDEGISGVVICLGEGLSAIRPEGEDGIFCEAGASMAAVCKFALEHSLTGLEFAWGLPGSLGGAVTMNAGAYGGEMKDVTVKVFHLSRAGVPGVFEGEELAFGYRESAYLDGSLCVTGALLRLKKGERGAIRERMDELGRRRAEKQPLDWPSAGSTFKRPREGYASALIDECGLRGRRVGGAMVSEKHAGFLINTGGATCTDVVALAHLVRDTVLERTGTSLETEIKLLGDGADEL